MVKPLAHVLVPGYGASRASLLHPDARSSQHKVGQPCWNQRGQFNLAHLNGSALVPSARKPAVSQGRGGGPAGTRCRRAASSSATGLRQPGQGPVQPALGDPAWAGGWAGWPTEVPSNPDHAV